MNLSIVIPCYNEIDNISKIHNELWPVVRGLAEHRSVEVVFVDDGSSDGTFEAMQKTFDGKNDSGISIKFAQHPSNLGLGAAIRTGFAAATGEIVMTTDSDGTYQFATIPDLLSLLKDDADIVTASPYHPDGGVVGVPRSRLILSQGSSWIYRILVDRRIHTYTCLFRADRRQVLENIEFQSNGFLGGTDILVKALLYGFRVVEFPAVLYRRVYGVSKAKIVRTILAHLQFQGCIILHRLHILTLFGNTEKKKFTDGKA